MTTNKEDVCLDIDTVSNCGLPANYISCNFFQYLWVCLYYVNEYFKLVRYKLKKKDTEDTAQIYYI